MDKDIYVSLIEEQFKGKEKLIEPNVKALNIGYNYAEENFKDYCEIKVQKSDKTDGLYSLVVMMPQDLVVSMEVQQFVPGIQ